MRFFAIQIVKFLYLYSMKIILYIRHLKNLQSLSFRGAKRRACLPARQGISLINSKSKTRFFTSCLPAGMAFRMTKDNQFFRCFYITFLIVLTTGLYSQDQSQNIFRLAQAFEQQQEYERALQLYNDLFVKDTTNYVYFDALRRMFVQLKRYDDAIALSVRRLQSTPFDFTLQSNIGSLFSMAGKEQKADSVWNLILQSANKNQMFFRAVANEQTNQRLFDKAIATYLRGRKESGDQFVFANELGYLYSFTMDFANTTREYLRLLRQNEQQFDFVQSRLATIISRPDGLVLVLLSLRKNYAFSKQFR